MDACYALEDDDFDDNPQSFKRDIFANANTSLTIRTKEDSKIHFLVSQGKGANYLAYCNKVVMAQDPVNTLKMYTEHSSDLYSRVNLSLASDSTKMVEHADFINQLRASVLAVPLLDYGTLFRGVDLSDIEIKEMEKLGRFFIPSFTSTSIDPQKAYSKNAMFHIKTQFLTRYACTVTNEYSSYHSTEQEVLLACYCAFQLERIEMVNSTKIVTVFLDDFASGCDKV